MIPRMSTFHVTGQVATISIRTRNSGTWNGSVLIPSFLVKAENQAAARGLAEQIIDPLRMAPASNIDITETPYVLADTALLSNELANAADALNGDSNDAEHDALYSVASTLAGLLGIDLDDLLNHDEL